MSSFKNIILISLIILFFFYYSNSSTEHFLYSPCFYNAQNRIHCSSILFPQHHWLLPLSTQYEPSYDLRGDYY